VGVLFGPGLAAVFCGVGFAAEVLSFAVVSCAARGCPKQITSMQRAIRNEMD